MRASVSIGHFQWRKYLVFNKKIALGVVVLMAAVSHPTPGMATEVPPSPTASCAPTVVSIASPVFGNLGALFRVLRATGWDIRLWPLVAQQKPASSNCDGN